MTDFLLHEHAALERGPRDLVLLTDAVLYSAWKVNGVPEQSAMLVFMKPFAALAVMYPV